LLGDGVPRLGRLPDAIGLTSPSGLAEGVVTAWCSVDRASIHVREARAFVGYPRRPGRNSASAAMDRPRSPRGQCPKVVAGPFDNKSITKPGGIAGNILARPAAHRS